MSTTTPKSDPADDNQERAQRTGSASGSEPPAWLKDIIDAAVAVRELAAAQWKLVGAEVALARSAAHTLLLAALIAVVFAVALGLTLLSLAGWALAHWFGSWAWGLLALAALQLACLLLTIMAARRCLRWMTLPESRAQLQALMRQTKSVGEHRSHATDSSNS